MARSKTHASKSSIDDILKKKSKKMSGFTSLNSPLPLLCNKVEPEYYVDRTYEAKLRTKFLQPFAKNNLLMFFELKKRFNLDHVKASYFNLVKLNIGIKSRLKDKVIRFTFNDFEKYLDLKSGGGPISLTSENLSRNNNTQFVMSMSKSVVDISMTNFPISQISMTLNLRKKIQWGLRRLGLNQGSDGASERTEKIVEVMVSCEDGDEDEKKLWRDEGSAMRFQGEEVQRIM
ncbi:hypothetical protein RYX36_019292 [Vicia faba]